MKRISKVFLVTLFSLIAGSSFAANTGDFNKTAQKNNDTTITTKSNIVIFKMLPTPTYTNNNGSLKKAGKVARTSNSRS